MWFAKLTLVLLFPLSLLAKPSLSGGADGGGGNLKKSTPVTRSELKKIVDRLPIYLTAVLNYQEFLFLEPTERASQPTSFLNSLYLSKNSKINFKTLTSVQQKLFPKNTDHDVFKELSSVSFVLSKTCRDLNFHHKDASAFNSNANEICLNESRLLGKLKSANVMTTLLALAVHELAHRMGANEEEANAIQELVQKIQMLGERSAFEAAIHQLPQFRWVPGLHQVKEQLHGNLPSNPLKTCMELMLLSKSINNISIWSQGGISTYRFHQISAMHAAQHQFDNLLGYCHERSSDSLNMNYYYQHRERIVSLVEYGQNTPRDGLYFRPENGFAVYAEYLNIENLKFNFNEFLKNFEIAQTARDLSKELSDFGLPKSD